MLSLAGAEHAEDGILIKIIFNKKIGLLTRFFIVDILLLQIIFNFPAGYLCSVFIPFFFFG